MKNKTETKGRLIFDRLFLLWYLLILNLFLIMKGETI
jgi:hypothetical protein